MLVAGQPHVGGADETGGAGDEQLHATASSAGALGEVGGEPVAPGGQLDRVFALAGQGRVGRARGGAAEHLGGGREHQALDFGLLEDLAGEVVPGARAGGGHVVDAELDPLDQADDPVGEVPGVGGRADLVAHDQDLVLGRGEAQHRLDEVGAADAEEPGGADDEVALVGRRRRLLAGELGAAVGRERRRLVGLDVGRALAAVEDVVAGDVDDAGADRGRGGGDVAGAGAVDRKRGLLGLLGPVDVGPGGAVDHDVGPLELELGAERGGVGDVELGVAEADHVVAGVAGGEDTSRPSIPPAPVTRTFIRADRLYRRSARRTRA